MAISSKSNTPRPVPRVRRGNPRLEEEIHDPYRSRSKPRTPAVCAQCGATYRNGRWTWQRLRPAPPANTVCPACRRTNDGYPAGELTITGTFAADHANEALRLIRNVEKLENSEHPLHRIMELNRSPSAITVTTTDIHLPRRIGHALEDAWGGTLTTHYDEQGHFVRARWERSA